MRTAWGGIARMKRLIPKHLVGLCLAVSLLASAPAWALGLDPAFPEPAVGPNQTKGVVVWGHGRSINAEDSQSPTPSYLRALRDNGWDVLRFTRASRGGALPDSRRHLGAH